MTHLFAWLAAIELLAIAWFLIAWPLFVRWPDRGFGLSKAAGVLLFGVIAWMLGWIPGIAVTAGVAWVVVGSIAAIAIVRDRREAIVFLGSHPSQWLTIEIVWLAATALFLLLRWRAPEIIGGEKFMDFALLNAAIRSPSLPIQDPWLAGYALNYYHFGYVAWAALTRMLSTPSSIAYNLAVAYIPGLVAAAACSIAFRLTRSLRLAAGSAIALVMLGNYSGALRIGSAISGTYDIWTPTRTIPGTINEFPFFTFLWADLHPHLLAMPNFLMFVALVLLLFERIDATRSSTGTDALLGVSAGIAAATSPWDLGAFSLLIGALLLTTAPRLGVRKILPGIVVFTLTALVVMWPFLRTFEGGGAMRIGVGSMHSHLGDFLLVQAVWILPAMLYVMCQMFGTHRAGVTMAASAGVALLVGLLSGSATVALLSALVILSWAGLLQTRQAPLVLIAPAFTLLLAAELFFVDDIYGAGLERMNIVFKFHLHAILLFAISAGAALQAVFNVIPPRAFRPVAALALAAIILPAAIYPAGAMLSAFASRDRPTLDGTAYLKQDNPGDLAAIAFLNARVPGQPVIAEATDSPYSYASRISANTGLPTILGWANHEIVWRRSAGAREDIARRSGLVRALYEGDSTQAAEICRRYRVRFVVVGDFERKTYPAGNFSKFAAMGRKVFDENGTALFEMNEGMAAQ